MINKVYEKLRHNVIAEYRRIYTPFFYINLKPKVYTYKVRRGRFYGYPAVWKNWECEGKDVSTFNKKFGELLDLNNDKPNTNVLKMRA